MLKRKTSQSLLLATGMLILILGVVVGGVLATDTLPGADLLYLQDAPPLTDEELNLAQLYQDVAPSVVSIVVTTPTGQSSGSGFVIDFDGHIVTNFHVVDNAQQVVVNFLDGTITRALINGMDPDSDLAVIQVNLPEDRLHPIKFGNSDTLVIGQSVAALGSPFGQRWTLTAGIVSALERRIQGLSGFSIGSAIQTDAPINPGNSGGPLFNLAGEVIGVNSQIRSDTGVNSGIGFAIPSNLTRRVAKELIENGSISYSFIGITGDAIDLTAMESLNLKNNQRGVVVLDVIARSPAEVAGLQRAEYTQDQFGNVQEYQSADIITAIDGEEIRGFEALISYLAQYTRPGDTVTFTVLRGGNTLELPVTLTSRP